MPKVMEYAQEKGWSSLDNAAQMYSAIQREDYSAIYRFSAVMKRPVEPDVLQEAIWETMPRFPGFQVKIRRGVFWYYFEPNHTPGPFVQQDIRNPCQPIHFRREKWLVRFFYYECRISVEVFHALADGAGALVFFKTLLAVYLRRQGYDIPNTHGVLDVTQPPRPEEQEDAYARYAISKVRRGMASQSAYQGNGTPEPFYTLNITMGLMPIDRLRQVSKSYGASITEYLAAVLIQSIIEKQKKEGRGREKPVSLAVPINLRPYFPSETLRNFILTLRPVIDPALGDYSFEEIVAQVHHQMRLQTNRHKMAAVITKNVALQRNPWMRGIPAPLKNFGIDLSYRLFGSRPYSTTFTNPGAVPLPPEMEEQIQRLEVVLGQSYTPRSNCASISCGNTMCVTFAGIVRETDMERGFFSTLIRHQIPVKIISNREE